MKNIKFLKVLLLNVFVLLFLLSSYNCGVNDVDGKNINISGVVTDQSGNPVDSALVELTAGGKGFFGSTPVIRVTALTNSQGHYSLSKFFDKKGLLSLIATKEFYENSILMRDIGATRPQWTDEPQVINIKFK